jgi:hypothetical protein
LSFSRPEEVAEPDNSTRSRFVAWYEVDKTINSALRLQQPRSIVENLNVGNIDAQCTKNAAV